MNSNKLKAIDFFCSGGGMTRGMSDAGIDVIAGIDNDPTVRDTYEKNNIGSKFIEANVAELTEECLKSSIDIKVNDDNLILIGCSPCQYWTKIRTDKKKSEKSKDLLKEFKRFVIHFNPGFVVVENVPGLEKRAEESGLKDFVDYLENNEYVVEYKIYNLNEYGVPQSRKRFSLIASRIVKEKLSPNKAEKKLFVEDFIGVLNGFARVEAGHVDKSEFNHSVAKLSNINLKRIEQTGKNGGSWLDWKDDKELSRKKYTGKEFIDNYGRMSWNKPAPTITTRFNSLSNGRHGHPEENRAISIREGASLQTFSKDYIFYTESNQKAAKMIGNAVPPEFARRIGETILKGLANGNRKN